MPKHGETRHFGIQRVDGEQTTLTDTSGEVVYQGASSFVEQTVAQTYCSHCQQWIQTDGVMGPLRFMAKHDSADCTKS